MTEIKIREAAGKLHGVLLRMMGEPPANEEEEKQVGQAAFASAAELVTQLLVDVHRIADALEAIARNTTADHP